MLNPQLRPQIQLTQFVCIIEFTEENELNDVCYGAGRHHAKTTA
jgi:hypothetical protein